MAGRHHPRRLDHVDTVSETAYVCFDDQPQGTRIVVPTGRLWRVTHTADEPDLLYGGYVHAHLTLRDMSPPARLEK